MHRYQKLSLNFLDSPGESKLDSWEPVHCLRSLTLCFCPSRPGPPSSAWRVVETSHSHTQAVPGTQQASNRCWPPFRPHEGTQPLTPGLCPQGSFPHDMLSKAFLRLKVSPSCAGGRLPVSPYPSLRCTCSGLGVGNVTQGNHTVELV